MNYRGKFLHNLQLVAAEAIGYFGDFTHPAAGHACAYLLPWPAVPPSNRERWCLKVHKARFQTFGVCVCIYLCIYLVSKDSVYVQTCT